MHPDKKSIRSLLRRRQCGLGGFRPQVLQRFACMEGYSFLLCLFGVCTGVFPMYTISQVTTIEKHFKLTSQQAGFLVGSSEFGFLATSLLIGHFLSTSHRPRILAACLAVLGLGSLLMAAPGFHHVANNVSDTSRADTGEEDKLCSNSRDNSTCTAESTSAAEAEAVYYTLVMGMVLDGIGSSCLWTLGIAYIDDNSSKAKSPTYIGVVMCIRSLAPILGIAMGSGVTKIPVHLTGEVGEIGCWWLGYLPITLLAFTVSAALFLFPEELSIPEEPETNARDRRRSLVDPETLARRKSRAEIRKMSAASGATARPSRGGASGGRASGGRLSSVRRMSAVAADTVTDAAITAKHLLKTFPSAMFRLARNPAYICVCLSLTAEIAIMSYVVFLPKYLETLFHISTTHANIVVGVAAPVAGALGVLLGGIIISKVKVTLNTQVLVVIVVLTVIYLLEPLLLFIKCDVDPIQGLNGSILEASTCSSSCHCDAGMFKPVCGDDGNTYFSPCHAGCTQFLKMNETFQQCSCISWPGGAVAGPCTQGCEGRVVLYAAILSILVVISGMGSMPLTMLILRCVEPRDKSLGLAVINVVISMGVMPMPALFGALIDQTCLVHQTSSCGQASSACAHYDAPRLRLNLHLVQYARLVVPLLLLAAWYATRKTVFDGDQPLVKHQNDKRLEITLDDLKEEDIHEFNSDPNSRPVMDK